MSLKSLFESFGLFDDRSSNGPSFDEMKAMAEKDRKNLNL